MTRLDNVPVCRPELIALHLFAVCREDRAERLVDSLWSMRLLSGPSLERFIDEHGACGRNGTVGVRTYLAARGPGYVPPASGVESRAMELFARHGIPMRRQVNSGGAAAWTGRVDFRHESVPLIVEVQSERYHSALVDQLADSARIAALRADGYEVVEASDADIFTRPGDALGRVSAALARLLARPS